MNNRSIAEQTEARINIPGNQKAWKYIRDVTYTNVKNLNRNALVDGAGKYTYGLLFREWERYASVFSALGMTWENHSAYNIFDLFNTAAPSVRTARGSFHDPFGFFGSLFSEENGGRKFLRMPEIPENVMSALLKYGNRMAGIPAGRKKMDHDFEE